MNRTTLFALSLLVSGSVAAMPYYEMGDAGETLDTAAVTTGYGDLTSITGYLDDLGGGTDDIDLYKIYIADTALFSVEVESNLSIDNDGMLFLFDAAGALVAHDDDSGPGYIPLFDSGVLAGYDAGTYYLGFDLYDTWPHFDSSGELSYWHRDPDPFQVGEYTLYLSGARFSVPEPSTWLLLGAGVVGLAAMRRRNAS